MARNKNAIVMKLYDALGATTSLDLPPTEGAKVSYSYKPNSKPDDVDFTGGLAYVPKSGAWKGEVVSIGFTGYYDEDRDLWLRSGRIQDEDSRLLIKLVQGDSPILLDLALNDTRETIDILGIDVMGNRFSNRMTGGDVDDVLKGAGGNDVLKGGGGRDTLWGGTGRDTLFGQSNSDTFQFRKLADSTAAASGRDTIRDFDAQDYIDLHLIDANTRKGGNNAFTFIGDAQFDDRAGELRYAGGVISGDVNGDGRADFKIDVANRAVLHDYDFVL